MKDIAEGQVAMYNLQVRNEELIAYMKPTLEQREQLRLNLIRIAYYAIAMQQLLTKEN